MRIALLTAGIFPFRIGGIQKHSYHLAKHLANEGFSVVIFCSNEENSVNLNQYFSTSELDKIEFNFIKFPNLLRFPGHYVASSYLFSKKICEELLKKGKFDWIYAQGFTSWFLLRKYPYQENVVTNLHGLNMFQNTPGFIEKIKALFLQIPAKQIIKRSYKQISLGGKLSNILLSQGAADSSIIVLPNGIDNSWIIDEPWRSETKKESEKRQLIFIGRYERLKGIEEFQNVIQKTIEPFKYGVLFIGPIPEKKRMKHPDVRYLGEVEDSVVIRENLKNSDILVSPSYSEGMPTVILEAMASGCAIIATDVGANDTMVDEKNGWLIKGDIERGLQKAIQEAVEVSDDKLAEMKKTSLNRVKQKFTWRKVIRKTIKELNLV